MSIGADRKGRKPNERAWKVSAEEIKERNYNLDIKNPHTEDEDHGDPEELLAEQRRAHRTGLTVINPWAAG